MSYLYWKILEEAEINYESNFFNSKYEEILILILIKDFFLIIFEKEIIKSSLFITEFNDFK